MLLAYYNQPGHGAQIDLLFDRSDGASSLCEIKYTQKLFVIDKACAKNLMQKILIFESHQQTDKQVFLAMVTTKGVKKNIWSEDLVENQVRLGELFLDG